MYGGMFGGMFGSPMMMPKQDDEEHKKMLGMLPMMSPLAGMFMSGHPNLGLGMISPGLGLARALGAFR